MHVFSLCEFGKVIGERPRDVKNLIAQGGINHVIKRCDRIEFTADAALDYLAKKYPELLKAKHEYAGHQKRAVNEEIVKEEAEEGIVKKGREGVDTSIIIINKDLS